MPTWMVVEDEPDIYDVLLAMFEIWGIEGVAFVDGAEAIAWIEGVDQGRIRGDLPELAILDIRLPEASGPEVGARLRQSPILGGIAIVLITAYHMTPEEERAVLEESQADMLLYKPLPAMPQLRDAMDGVIEKHKAASTEDVSVASSEAATSDSAAQSAGEAGAVSTPAAPTQPPAPLAPPAKPAKVRPVIQRRRQVSKPKKPDTPNKAGQRRRTTAQDSDAE
ncbi:MAG: response regulator [Anaerolineae bacterium]|nr:response regulator [Anaerolineae bacterium]